MSESATYLTTTEAASYLRVHPETIRGWARRRVLPAMKLGNRGGFRFLRADLDRFLASRQVARHDGQQT